MDELPTHIIAAEEALSEALTAVEVATSELLMAYSRAGARGLPVRDDFDALHGQADCIRAHLARVLRRLGPLAAEARRESECETV